MKKSAKTLKAVKKRENVDESAPIASESWQSAKVIGSASGNAWCIICIKSWTNSKDRQQLHSLNGFTVSCHHAIFHFSFTLVFLTLFNVHNHSHSLFSFGSTCFLVFWFTHDQLRLILGYTLLLLSFTYSLFTLFHSRNLNLFHF